MLPHASPTTLLSEAMYTLRKEVKHLDGQRAELQESNDLLMEQISLMQRQNNDLAWQVSGMPPKPRPGN